jgi:hypothetical protein
MKAFVSLVVQFLPLLAVTGWLGYRYDLPKKMALKQVGPGVFASGLSTLIGAKYFDLVVFTKRSSMSGERAVEASLFIIALGLGLIILHYALAAVFPSMREISTREKRPNKSVQPTPGSVTPRASESTSK